MPKYDLREVLNKFNSKLSYKQFDRTALDISRSLAAGNLGDKDYATWATISDDPLVIVNIVRTFITTQVSKLSSAPYRPQADDLAEMGINARLDSQFVETYMDVLNDGYAFVAVGVKDGQPVVKPIDSRYIMYNGDDPTLADATEILVFEIVPKVEGEELLDCSFLSTYVDFDAGSERVKVTHYHKDKDGKFWMDYYDTDPNKPTPYELPNVDRLPVIRFVGERIELADKRYLEQFKQADLKMVSGHDLFDMIAGIAGDDEAKRQMKDCIDQSEQNRIRSSEEAMQEQRGKVEQKQVDVPTCPATDPKDYSV